MEELRFKSISTVLSSIASKTLFPWHHFMYYVENPFLTHHALSVALKYHDKCQIPPNLRLLVVNTDIIWTNFLIPCHRVHTQVYFWICDQLCGHYANDQPSDGYFPAYGASTRQPWLYQCRTYNCTLKSSHQIKVYRMSSVKKYISPSQFLFSLDLQIQIYLIPTD